MALLRERISNTRIKLKLIGEEIDNIEDLLHKCIQQTDFNKIIKWCDSSAKQAFENTRKKHISKFNRLKNKLQPRKSPILPRSQIIDKTVINLSSRNITDREKQVLALGLNFATTLTHIQKEDIIQHIEPTLTGMDKPAADSIRLEISRILSKAEPPKPNITKLERLALENLHSNSSIHILKADKWECHCCYEHCRLQS
ncbi:uncharacterized protein LOC117111498 [Anneissia japonica]|uniref:uncharacterized protein LOC117111498 n=1 Tax=Anneissia japonica TaxID=1529436 RepID=UPI001425A24C|nr:uncharacterized protein LOC117111498 [Anneissia japonica]